MPDFHPKEKRLHTKRGSKNYRRKLVYRELWVACLLSGYFYSSDWPLYFDWGCFYHV